MSPQVVNVAFVYGVTLVGVIGYAVWVWSRKTRVERDAREQDRRPQSKP